MFVCLENYIRFYYRNKYKYKFKIDWKFRRKGIRVF